ncbi:MAG: hypothetical protein LBT59_09105 [Clostridiales bacterium]|nr:hypothetical protein [Clostridiales bacterium]
MSETIESLLRHIPKQAISRAVLKANRQYLGVKLMRGPHMEYADLFLYVGKSSQLNPHALSKRIGLILQNDAGLDIGDSVELLDLVELSDGVDLIALYEELKDLWCNATISAMASLANSGNIHEDPAKPHLCLEQEH